MTPEQAHEIYLETSRKLNWPVRPENNVPYDQLSEDAKALDIAFSEACNKEVGEAYEACAKMVLCKQPCECGCVELARAIRARGGK